MESHASEHGGIRVRTYTVVWAGLLILTGITVTAARMHLGKWSVLTALFIASVKSLLVLFFFMHLKDEKSMFRWMFLTAVVTLTVFIGMTFFDIAFR